MTGKRRHNIIIDSEVSSDESNMNSDHDNSTYRGSSNGSSVTVEQKPRRRGRGPSKRPCLNRNAMMARVNRQKKKEYLEHIEKKLSQYRAENKNLTNLLQKQGIDLKRLNAEVSYLKNILNNNTAITALLNAMNEVLQRKNRAVYHNDNKQDIKKTIATKLGINDTTGIDLNMLIALDSESSGDYYDHNYAYPGIDDRLFNFEGVNCDFSTGLSAHDQSISMGSNSDSIKASLISPDNVDLGVTDQDIEALAVDNNIFDSFTDSEVNNEPIDFIRPENSSMDTGNLFENLENSGVCVHLNSGRISLEFCSICHLNSVNSDDP